LESNIKEKERSLDDVFWSSLVPLYIGKEESSKTTKKEKNRSCSAGLEVSSESTPEKEEDAHSI